MTDKEQKEMLTNVLKALFGPTFAGKYLVEVRGSHTLDAKNKKDAIEKTKEYYREHFDELNFNAVKVEDLLNKEN